MRCAIAALIMIGLLTVGPASEACSHEIIRSGPAHPTLHRHLHRAPPPTATASFPRAYPWGYFGAQPGRYRVSHRGHYGDYWEWGYRRAY
jgi:hypothetical protein